MPSADASFRDLVLQLRGRSGLTQRELAARIGVHARSIQGWEVGVNFPGVASLKALIAVGVQTGGFTPGREAEEARALWAAAVRDAPRFRMPFDDAWFQQISVGLDEPVQDGAEHTVATPATTNGGTRRESWGEAPDVAGFVGRAGERAQLNRWVLDEGSRLVTVLGLGGIGKSLLATRIAHDLAPSFERVFWRSLRDAPTPGEWLSEAISYLAPDAAPVSGGEAALLRCLLEILNDVRCLLVLDNLETVLQPGRQAGDYRPGYERYGALLRQVAESPHRSCLVITSREEPAELGPLLGERGPVRALDLAGFGTEDGRALLDDKQLDGDEGSWRALVERYGGNGLALRVVGETTRELFGGSIAEYLTYAAATSGVMVGGVRQLLGAQVQRLSDLEVELLRRMAVEREPVALADLAADLSPRIGRGAVLATVEGLRRRSLLERSVRGPLFVLHSVVLEYVTEELIDVVAQELTSGEPDLLLRQPVLKATAKDYIRRSQERLICAPLVERLVEASGSARAAEQRLVALLDEQRERPPKDQGFGPGNVVNLLRLLRGDLRGVDLSGLAIRQVYLQEVEAQGASLAGAHFSETVLSEAFSNPLSIALSADGANLVVGTASGEVCWWRVADRTLLMTLPGHSGAILGVAVSGDGRLLASGDGETVRLWDAETGRPLVTLSGHAAQVWCVAVSRDGRLLASGDIDGTVRLWEAETGLLLVTLQGHAGGVRGVAVSGDGHLVASGGADGMVRLWDVEGGRLLATLRGHDGGVWGVALSRDGRLIASGGLDGTVRLWDAEARLPLAALQGHTSGIWGVALSGDGRLVASGGVDGTVRLWETDGGQALAALHEHASGVRALALSADGRLVASGSFDGTVRLWDAERRLPLAALQGHTSGIWGVALSGDGRLVASGGVDGAIRLWETGGGQALAPLAGHVGAVWDVALSRDGRLLASGGYDGTVRLWATEAGRPLATLHGHAGQVWSVALGGDGRLLASVGGGDGTVRLWGAETGRPLAILQGHTGEVRGVAVSADSQLVASASTDGTVRLWEAATGQPGAILCGHTVEVHAVALSGDGRVVASGGFDGTVCLWDAASGVPLGILRGHSGAARRVALSEDGRLVASGGMDGTVRLWDAGSGQPLAVLPGAVGAVWGVGLSGDGLLLASGGFDGTVRVWDLPGGTPRHALRGERHYEALDITGLSGVTDAQRQTLFALGAIERSAHAAPPG